MEKPKFEFQKLQLPKQTSGVPSDSIPINYSAEYQKADNQVNRSIFMDAENAPQALAYKSKSFPYGYLILFTAIGLAAGYYAHELLSANWSRLINPERNAARMPSKNTILDENQIKNTAIQPISADSTKNIIQKRNAARKPVYFNYYDSIIFLNDIKGSKIVVSKGRDEYIKQDKIIVKSDGYYYNVFCKDLYNNYAVGDSIP